MAFSVVAKVAAASSAFSAALLIARDESLGVLVSEVLLASRAIGRLLRLAPPLDLGEFRSVAIHRRRPAAAACSFSAGELGCNPWALLSLAHPRATRETRAARGRGELKSWSWNAGLSKRRRACGSCGALVDGAMQGVRAFWPEMEV
jgi:hypothetical protein